MLCNDVKREGVKASPDLASRPFQYVPLHKIRYGITTTSWAGFVGAKIFHTILEGYRISVSDPDAAAIVTRPFVVEVSPSGEEYIATSRISNTYEFGATPDQAISTYLEFLVDELIWLQKNEVQLSPSIQEDLRLLQRYLRIV